VHQSALQQYGGGAIAIAIAVGLSFISAVVALAAHMTIALHFLAGRGPFSTVGRTRSLASGS
jgi:hypothetical protein